MSKCKKFMQIVLPSVFFTIIKIESIYYVGMLIICLCALFWHPFFYSVTLWELVLKIDALKTVINAITGPGFQIIITLILFFILEYIFSLFAIFNFPDHFPNQEDVKNIYKTFLRTIDQTFKQDGGVGSYLSDPTKESMLDVSESNSFIGLRFWFDNLFNFVVIIFIMGMFLSIIKDYFSRQREDQDNFKEIKQKKCLICGIMRGDIERIHSKNKNAFEVHTYYNHYIYDYVKYLSYLSLKGEKNQDRNIEMVVWQQHVMKNYFFLPKKTCFKLEEQNYKIQQKD